MRMLRAETGIDYLTATLPLDSAFSGKMLEAGFKLQVEAKREGNDLKAISFMGYEGSLCGSVFVGSGLQGTMVRVSSQRAIEAAAALRACKPNITRIDLQVTVFYPEHSEAIIRRHYETARTSAKGRGAKPKRNVERREKNDGGYTVYIGQRTSQYFGRAYDKHKESKDNEYAGAIRYEVEIKGKPALQAYTLLKVQEPTVHVQIASFVAEWFAKRGIRPQWIHQVGELDIQPIKPDTSDTARRLKWLRTQVRHTCKLLLQEVDATVILEALGFLEAT